MNKYEAAKCYNNGFKFAMFREGEPNFDDPMFMAGYNHAARIKEDFSKQRNAILVEFGYEPIHKVTLADVDKPNVSSL